MDTANDKALQRFAELMIEKIKQVEDNWQKPWFGIKGGGLPQNIEGRTYNGVNSFMLFLLSEKEQYSLPVYMTFMQAKDSGLNILKGEKSFPVIYWNFSVRDKNGKKIPFDVYKNLDKNEQQEYKVKHGADHQFRHFIRLPRSSPHDTPLFPGQSGDKCIRHSIQIKRRLFIPRI